MINSACHDNQADQYDKRIKNDQKKKYDYIRENYNEIHRITIKNLQLIDGDKLLDIGIGTGLLEEKIEEKISICGIDISEKMLNKTKEKGLGIELKIGSFLDIPYTDNLFNRIVTCFAFHHLNNNEKHQAMKEMFRVMTKNGILVIADFMYENDFENSRQREWFVANNRNDMIEEMDDENFTNIEWLYEIAENNRHRIEVIKGSTISWIVKIS